MISSEDLPDIYYFNPTCEYAVANGHSSWQPNQLLQKMEADLAALPLYIARPQDVVLVNELPSESFLKQLERLEIIAPRFVNIQNATKNREFISTPKNWLLPWGWSPVAHRLLNPLKPSCSASFKSSPVAIWKPEYKDIYSKKFALGILKEVLPQLPDENLLPFSLLPEICYDRKCLETLLNRWGKLMVKEPWSSSGRGLQRITKIPVAPKVWEKLMGIINEQGYAIAEPFLDKILDMAYQFVLLNGKVSFIGISRFITDQQGQYQGNFLNGWPVSIDRQIIEFAEEMTTLLVPCLSETIENSLLAKYYEGNFGIDTLIFLDKNNHLSINPCLEINVRKTMGLLALRFEKLLAPGTKGIFKIYFNREKKFFEFIEELQDKYPLQTNNNQITQGFFPLSPANKNTLFGAYLQAGIQPIF